MTSSESQLILFVAIDFEVNYGVVKRGGHCNVHF